MSAFSAAATSSASASALIMVPVGLAGLAISTALSGFSRWAASKVCGVNA
jgi:hypothetical protein